MRQAGYLANAGIYALENNIERLSEDHKKAKEIGEVLMKSKFVKSVEKIETNIVVFLIMMILLILMTLIVIMMVF
jgi:threonine aldolase